MSTIYSSADKLIGRTPILELSKIQKEFSLGQKF
jgi:hypothetical protein